MLMKAAAKNTPEECFCKHTLSDTLANQSTDVTPETALAQIDTAINQHWYGIFSQTTHLKDHTNVRSVKNGIGVQII